MWAYFGYDGSMRRRFTHKAWLKALLSGSAIVLCAFTAVVLWQAARAAFYANRIYPGASIQHIGVGGMRLQDARRMLAGRIDAFSSRIALHAATQTLPASLDDLGVSVLLEDAIAQAYAPGHAGSLWQRLYALESGKTHPRNFNLRLDFNDAALDAYLEKQFGQTIEHPAKNASVAYDGSVVRITPAAEGEVINRALLKDAIRRQFEELSQPQEPIELTALPDVPRFTTQDAYKLKERIGRMLAHAPYALFGNRERFILSRDLVASWLRIDEQNGVPSVALAQEKIQEYLITIAPAVSQESRDAQLAADAQGAAYIEMPSEDTLRLNLEKTAHALAEGVEKDARSITVALDAAPARINETFLRDHNISVLLGRGKTDFTGSPRNRIHNLTVASEKYRGMLVAQGETFSFNAHIGDIDAQSGYKPELVIKDHKLIAEYGGGICQVSTTLFQAVMRAGMRVTERHQHSISVRYYNPQGFDATVYPPSPDFKFINTATGTIFIQPRIEGMKISFEIYGQPQAHTVVVEGPKILSAKPDGSLKTVVTQKILAGKDVVYQKSFWSDYKSPSLYAVERNPLE